MFVYNSDYSNNVSFTCDEIDVCLAKLKSRKSSAGLFVTGELLRAVETTGFTASVTALFNAVAVHGMPRGWNKLKLTSLYKGKGDELCGGNYRGISVMGIIPKLYSMCIYNKLYEVSLSSSLRAPT